MEISESETARLSLTKNTTFSELKKLLPFTDRDIQGKKVLDLGSGPESKFAKDVQDALPNTRVVSLDFDFNRIPRSELGQGVAGQKQNEGDPNLTRVEGRFTKLPFKDGSFEVVISNAAMPLYLSTQDQIETGFQEVIRVLKRGGKAFIGPITYTDIIVADPSKTVWETHEKHSYKESKKLFEQILSRWKGQIDFKFIPAEYKWFKGYPDMEERQVRPASLIITKR